MEVAIVRWCSILLSLLVVPLRTTDAAFNVEVERRVLDRLGDYLGTPPETTQLVDNYRSAGGFLFGMDGRDREKYLIFTFALPRNVVYFGLEDGTCVGHGRGEGFGENNYAYYRDPGFAAYPASSPENQKHFKSCVNVDNGKIRDCAMKPGALYMECLDDCQLEPCPDDQSQRNCTEIMSNSTEEELQQCESERKWCQKMEIKSIPTDTNETFGFLPLTYHCHDTVGRVTQLLGKSVDGEGNLRLCKFRDGKTPVNRTLAGDYFYCQGQIDTCAVDDTDESFVCDSMFTGGFRSEDYDPRYRPWYSRTKELQKPNWSPPFPFFDNLDIGVTFSHPIYNEMNGKQVFAGVVAIDYTFEQVQGFLRDSYGESETKVMIYESKDPQYLIGTSTAGKPVRKVLTDDESTECPDIESGDFSCKGIRVKVSEFTSAGGEQLLVNAYKVQQASGYPMNETLTVKEDDNVGSRVYVSQSALYEQLDADLKWRIVIVAPAEISNTEEIKLGDQLFGAICVLGGFGMIFCFSLFVVFFRNRNERAVVYADWRFTCLFLLGCTAWNGSTFTLLGENNDSTCMLRMWVFHLLFALTMAPLLAKTWRMMVLFREAESFRRVAVSHSQAAMYMLPLIVAELIVLIVFSVVDPYRQAEEIDQTGLIVTQRIVCSHDTVAFFVTQLVFEAGLVFCGCVLSYRTRNLDENFGESKQLFFAMYNIAFIGLVVVLMGVLMEAGGSAEKLLQAVGVFWGTVFSSASFVLPRMLRVGKDAQEKNRGPSVFSENYGNSNRPRLDNGIVYDSSKVNDTDRLASVVEFEEIVEEQPEETVEERLKGACDETDTPQSYTDDEIKGGCVDDVEDEVSDTRRESYIDDELSTNAWRNLRELRSSASSFDSARVDL